MTIFEDDEQNLNDTFTNRLGSERLGVQHCSLTDYHEAIKFVPEKIKEFSLIVVTEPPTRRILLGLKHRGFGHGMYNSFGGKLDPDENEWQCAARELLEETGITVTAAHLKDKKCATLHFTFEDNTTKMLVHAYRLDITCGDTSSSTEKNSSGAELLKVDETIIRACNEISPQWFQDWSNIPLDNMFADDSLWLTRILASTEEQLYIDGYFHFKPGGQEVNSIRDYFMDIQVRGKPRSLEQRLFHELHRNDITSPSIKEFKECFAFTKVVNSFFGKTKTTFDVVIDVAGGHGALAALLLITTQATKAIVLDPAVVGKGSIHRAWGHFLRDKDLTFRHECLRTGLPTELEQLQRMDQRILVVACHACQHLSDEILQLACIYGVPSAVMPCCQKDLSPGSAWKSISKNLDIPVAKCMDLLLAGKAMSWGIGMEVRMKMIDSKITPQNRIILCRPRLQTDTTASSVDEAHARLKRAYKKAHQSSSHDESPKKELSMPTTLLLGIALGVVGLLGIQMMRR